MEKIVAVDRNRQGEIISFLTSSGRVISYRKALEEIAEGHIEYLPDQAEALENQMNMIQLDQSDFDHYPPIY